MNFVAQIGVVRHLETFYEYEIVTGAKGNNDEKRTDC
jgi:hypothetical protein